MGKLLVATGRKNRVILRQVEHCWELRRKVSRLYNK